MSELIIKLETVDPVEFFGFNNNKLKILKREFNRLNINARGNKLIVAGNAEELDTFNEKVNQLVDYMERYGKISDQHMEEILGESDRIAVMHEGKITGILNREEASEEAIMKLAVGSHEG